MADEPVLHVLVADDETGIRTGVRRALERVRLELEGWDEPLRFAVETAADGDRAMARLEEGGIDIVMLDHSMPGLTGMEILDRLRQTENPPLIIMITAYASLDMAVRATKQGAFDFLGKPFDPTELRKVAVKAAKHLAAQRAAKRLADERHRVRFEFLSVLAHELKAPLGAVEGYLQLLDEDIVTDDPAEVKRVVGRCLARLGGMRKLIFDLLDLTRIESGAKKRNLVPLDVAGLVDQALETFEPQAAARGIALASATEGDTTMIGDPGEMEIMLNNLVSNAVKYNRDGGRVDVTVAAVDDDTLRLSVADTGIGMSAEEQESLFGEFARIRNEDTRNIEGSGLGLSILRRLARLNGGDVAVTSRKGEGTTFAVTLARRGTTEEAS